MKCCERKKLVLEKAEAAQNTSFPRETSLSSVMNGREYVNFIDVQKAFDSADRESLWSILRAYGIPARIVRVI